jgi:hypothetical protein
MKTNHAILFLTFKLDNHALDGIDQLKNGIELDTFHGQP